MSKTQFKKKLQELLIGKRSPKERFLTAFCPSLILSFILFFFGPLDLSRLAEDYVDYTIFEILPTCLKVWGLSFALFFLVSWIPGGKLHVWISSLFCGLALAFYIQGNWLNIDLGALDGSAIDWQKYGDNALVNFVIFALIVQIPLLIHFFSRKIWKNFTIFVSTLLLIMQLVPLSITFIQHEKPDNTIRYRVNKDKEYVLGQWARCVTWNATQPSRLLSQDIPWYPPSTRDPVRLRT